MRSISESPAAAAVSVQVLLFGLYADLAGQEGFPCAVAAGATVADLVASLRSRFPSLGRMPERVMVAVNQVHARLDTPLSDGDEVAILPPLAGG